MHQTYRPVASSLATLQTLRELFGERFRLLQNPPGTTEFSVLVDHRDYLQNLGVPPDSRQYPSSSSLHHFPFFVVFDFVHAGNQYKPHLNGTVVDLFIGSSYGAATAWDCKAAVAYRLGFRQTASRLLLPEQDLHACQKHLLRVLDQRLETLLSRQLVKKEEEKE